MMTPYPVIIGQKLVSGGVQAFAVALLLQLHRIPAAPAEGQFDLEARALGQPAVKVLRDRCDFVTGMDPDWGSTCAQGKSTRDREASALKMHTQREREESRKDQYLRVLCIVSQIVPAAPDVLGRVPDRCGEEQVVHLHIYKVPALAEKQPARHPGEPDVRQG
jgi:hypothetical protein